MYVTLEPCCHYGKTPPCTEAIIKNKIKKVVVGCLDPNEKVAGKGIQLLQDAGIEVEVGILEKSCKKLNKIFFHYIQTKTPYVLMKYGMTLDGKIATTQGLSKWITNEQSRANVHQTRNEYQAIMVGVGTVLADNPELTCRLKDGRNPIRIICDSYLRTPLESKVVETAKSIRTILATTIEADEATQPYSNQGIEIMVVPRKNNRVDLCELMKLLGEKGIDSILLEGGGNLNFSALESEIVQEIHTYIAPKVFGGERAKSPIMGNGFNTVMNKVKLKKTKILNFDEDILIESEVSYVYRDC